MQPNVEFYFFYHSADTYTPIRDIAQSPQVHPVNLTECPLPQEFEPHFSGIPGLDAALSEYVGHLSITPCSEIVGLFNYSLFEKFSRRWAVRMREKSIFLPSITTETLSRIPFERHNLYCAELLHGDQMWGFLKSTESHSELVSALEARYPCNTDDLIPLKGSYLLNREIFIAYQDWLRREIPGLIELVKDTSAVEANPFSKLHASGEVDHELQIARASIGGCCERAAGWFLNRTHRFKKVYRIGDLQRDEPRSLSGAAGHVADKNKNVVLVFCDSKYVEVLDNWLCHMEEVGDLPILVCALDEDLAIKLADEGVTSCHLQWSGNLSDLWRLRLQVIAELTGLGYNVTHSDADAIWRSDPIELLNGIDADIVASQGTVWPPSTLAEWGHVLCFGFIQFKATTATNSVLAQMLTNASIEGFDDQKVLNELLEATGMIWETNSECYNLQFKDKSFSCYNSVIHGVGQLFNGISIHAALLPHFQFQRLPNNLEDADKRIVVHPFAEKTAGDTKAILRNEACWYPRG